MKGRPYLKKQTFLFSSAILILSALAAKLTGAIFRIPLANMLGGTGMGYFSSAYSIFMTVYAVSVTGLPAAVAKLTAEKSALQRYSDLRRVKSSALLFFSAAGLAFTAVTMLLAYPFCRFSGGGMAAMPAVLAIAPSVFFSCVTSVYRGYYEGLRNMFPTAVSQIIEGLVKLCSGLALCLLVLKNPHKFESFFVYFRDTEDPLLPIAIGALVTNLTSLIDLVTIMRSLSSAAEKYPGFFAEISGNIPTAEIPNFLFGSFTGLAVTIFNLVPSCTNMFGKGILPAVSEAFAARDHKQVRLSTEKAMFATALVSFPSAVGICVLSGEILGTLFPTKPLETEICTLSLSILGIAVAFLCMSSTVFAILQAAGRPDLPVKLMLAGVAVKLAGNLLLVRIPQLNIAGAAISTLICYTVICLPAIDAAVKLTNADISYLKGIFCKICYCSVMCGGSALLARNMLAEVLNPLPLLIISIFCGVIIYILTALLLGIITKNTLNLLIS